MNQQMIRQRGQMTIEMILLLSIFVGISLTVMRYANQQKWMENLVSGPWRPLQGMIEDGVWVDVKTSKDFHPSLKGRHGSFNGDDVP